MYESRRKLRKQIKGLEEEVERLQSHEPNLQDYTTFWKGNKMVNTPKDILRDRAKYHVEERTTYTGVVVDSPRASQCQGCLWCRPEAEDWKAHDEAKRMLRMMEKVN